MQIEGTDIGIKEKNHNWTYGQLSSHLYLQIALVLAVFYKLTTITLGLANMWFLSGDCDTLMVPFLAIIGFEWFIVIACILTARRVYEGGIFF